MTLLLSWKNQILYKYALVSVSLSPANPNSEFFTKTVSPCSAADLKKEKVAAASSLGALVHPANLLNVLGTETFALTEGLWCFSLEDSANKTSPKTTITFLVKNKDFLISFRKTLPFSHNPIRKEKQLRKKNKKYRKNFHVSILQAHSLAYWVVVHSKKWWFLHTFV